MEELIRSLTTTTSMLRIQYQTIGSDMTINLNITDYELTQDGIELFFDNDSHFFISTILTTIIDKDDSGSDVTIYTLKNGNKDNNILSIVVEK